MSTSFEGLSNRYVTQNATKYMEKCSKKYNKNMDNLIVIGPFQWDNALQTPQRKGGVRYITRVTKKSKNLITFSFTTLNDLIDYFCLFIYNVNWLKLKLKNYTFNLKSNFFSYKN